jgi:diadenosine tetraphosphate (Ap4A) HIT family hydrolase
MNRSEECFICLKHRGGSGGAVFENTLIFIGHAAISKDGTLPYLGHYLVEPKRHTAEMGDLSDAEAQAVGLQLTRTARVLQAETGAEHIYVFVLGHHVDHLHIHVVPRYPGTPRAYWGLHLDGWPGAPRGSRQAIHDFNTRMRYRLAEETL